MQPEEKGLSKGQYFVFPVSQALQKNVDGSIVQDTQKLAADLAELS